MTASILIVDDSATDRMMIQNMLSDYHTCTACNGEEALQIIHGHEDIDLIILDLNMPVMNGFEMLEALKKNEYSRDIRTIILTNYDELDKEIRGLKAGAIDYIRKPVNLESLRVRINIHLQLLNIQRLYKRKLMERSLTLGTIFDQAPIGIALAFNDKPADADNRNYTIINPMFESITGRTKDELIKAGWVNITHPDDVELDKQYYRKFTEGSIDTYNIQKRYIKPNGSVVWVDMIVTRLHIRDNYKYNHICLVQDITEKKKVEKALVESERSKAVLLSNLPGMAYRSVHDSKWTMKFVSGGCEELTGYHQENLVNNNDISFNDLILPEYRDMVWDTCEQKLSLKKPFEVEYEILTAEKKRKWVLDMGQGVYSESGTVKAIEGIIIDISDRKAHENQLKYLSEHDILTGLYSRNYFEQFLSERQSVFSDKKRAVLLLNIKKINMISLTYGYDFSEKIIKDVAKKLFELVSNRKKLFHISSERFVFFIEDYKDKKELISFYRQITENVSQLQIINALGCEFGIYELKDEEDAGTVLKNVSIAAERVDNDIAFGYCFFDDTLSDRIIRESHIKDDLLDIAENKGESTLYLMYQPLLNLKNNKIKGFEALARLKSSQLGEVTPVEFIPMAEEVRLLVPIGMKILRMAGGFMKKLKDNGYDDICVSVNVSPIQFLRNEFLEDLEEAIKEMQIDTRTLCLEITESIFTDDFEMVNRKIARIRDMGIKVAIDDFGTGYSSLSRERELQVDFLKIDKYFADKLLESDPDKAITSDIISIAHKLGHIVIAEGIEHEFQKKYLIENNCDVMQGFLFSRPLMPEDALILLKNTNEVT